MTKQKTFPGFHESLIKASIETYRQFVPTDGTPYWGCFSGGKDSVLIKALAAKAEVPVEWHYSVTTIDPPELVHFIRREHPDVSFDRPPQNFFTVAQTHGFPTRVVRWCCKKFKESRTPRGRVMVLGVRAAESVRRKANWSTLTYHRASKANAVLPIIHWRDDDVWRYIHDNNLPYCSLYDEGWKRLGCIGCPMSRKAGRERDFARWPGYKRKWQQLFQRVWNRRTGLLQRDGRIWFGDRFFDNWEEMWEWWMNDEPLPKSDECQGQLEMWV